MTLPDFLSMCTKISERATTIPKGSTSEVYADGSGGHPCWKDDDIVYST